MPSLGRGYYGKDGFGQVRNRGVKIGVVFVLILLLATVAPASRGQRGAATSAPDKVGEAGRGDGAGLAVVPGKEWKHVASVEKAGWSREKLSAARRYADSIQSSAVMIVQGREVVDEWGDVDIKISSYSVRKSLISALYGIYSAEGIIDVNATLEQMGIDDAPDPLTKAERQARVVDLLRARSGIYHPVDFETPYQKTTRPARGSHAPGTFWFYNNWDYNALGTIFEKQTEVKIGKAFYERVAVPIGMQDFKPEDVYYMPGPTSVHAAFHFEITARDLARFGLLYLHHGRWGRRQVVPEAWVEKSTHANEMVKFHDVETGGYEYLWWVEYGGAHLPEASLPGMYSARGAGGHYLLVVPSLDLVIVNRADNDSPTKDAKTVMEVAMRPGIDNAKFGHLVKLILEARTGH
jgi:CubicO group peptidase (beta-lactamase class C family)